MKKAKILINDKLVGHLEEGERGKYYRLEYLADYQGPGISLALPSTQKIYEFVSFPPFFDGLLPEGPQLEGLLRQNKLDRNDTLGQLIAVGRDLVGVVTVEGDQ